MIVMNCTIQSQLQTDENVISRNYKKAPQPCVLLILLYFSGQELRYLLKTFLDCSFYLASTYRLEVPFHNKLRYIYDKNI